MPCSSHGCTAAGRYQFDLCERPSETDSIAGLLRMKRIFPHQYPVRKAIAGVVRKIVNSIVCVTEGGPCLAVTDRE